MDDEKQVEHHLCLQVAASGGLAYKWVSPGCIHLYSHLAYAYIL